MKLRPIQPGVHAARCAGTRGFTLTEMMAACGVLGLVMAAVVFGNLHGLRMIEATQPKLAAESEARRLFSRLSAEIASAKLLRVGEGDASIFTPVETDAPRQGGALHLEPTTDANVFIRYFWDAGDQTLKRCSSDSLDVLAVARGVTNNLVFAAVDYRGFPAGVLTNDQRNLAISVLLQFSEIEGTSTPVGPDRYFKSHQFQTEIARRAY
jgi:prepilin-type N-terminal cleavage/methylation domain-containing protein